MVNQKKGYKTQEQWILEQRMVERPTPKRRTVVSTLWGNVAPPFAALPSAALLSAALLFGSGKRNDWLSVRIVGG